MSKRLDYLWQDIVSFDNLLLAYKKARRGKQHKTEVANFSLNLENELLTLQQQLIEKTYRPGDYRLFTIYERKPRQIAAAPFRDRVVHHALLNIVEPLLDRRFIDDSYACRKNKGVHKAVDRYQTWAKRYAYALKMDIQQYFPSIDHSILKQKISRHIKDPHVLNLFSLIIDTSPVYHDSIKGLPIGNLTSQFLANLYLDSFDHYIKEQLRVKAYLRYVDDFIILSDSKIELHQLKLQIQHKLTEDNLLLHPNKCHVLPTHAGLDVLGYRVFPYKRLLRNDNGHRFIRNLRKFSNAYRDYRIDFADFNPSVQSWIGHAAHADTEGLRNTIFSSIVFQRGTCQDAACSSGRFMEQQPSELAFC